MTLKTKVFSFICAVILASCGNEPVKEDIAEETKIHEKQLAVQTNFNSNWKVKEGYIVKVYRNDQLDSPIFFKGLLASIWFDENKLDSAQISASINPQTVETGNYEMNAHAKEESVLDAQRSPLITFVSKSVKKTENGYEATGNLNLKSIIQEIKLPFTFRNDTFSGKFVIKAKDFEITRNGAVPNGTIQIELTIPVTK